MRRIGLLFPIVLFCLFGLGWYIFSHRTPASAPNHPLTSLDEVSPSLVQTSFATKSSYSVATGTRILLLPHHLVAGREIASLLAATPTPTHIILLSPDHFSQGKQWFSTTNRTFAWQTKTIPQDDEREQGLIDSLPTLLAEQNSVFTGEHGIRGLIPFITTAWPNAAITALTVRVDTPNKAMDQFASVLQESLQDPNTLLIVTIDFSHDLPAYIADIHDLLAIDALQASDITASSKVEIDSPPLFYLLTTLARASGLSLRVQAHTNALRLMKALVTELGTSHLLANASPGVPASRTLHTTLFHDPARPVVSSEDRFYQGFDQQTSTTIPWAVDFVRVDRATSTEWLILPLKEVSAVWLPLSDSENARISSSQRAVWLDWAKTYLPKSYKP